MNRLVFLICLVLATLGAQSGCGQALSPRTLVWQGSTRTWYEHVPASYNGATAVPLVIVLHGNSGRGDSFAPGSEWMPQADASGFIAVFPNGGVPVGTDFGWNAFVYDGSAPDDAGFLAAMIARIQTEYKIDPARVYMVGFSNGGGMTSTFAGLHASTLAAIAPVSGGWLTSFGIPTSAMHPDAPLPVWIWRGAAENFPNGSLTLAQQDAQQLQYWIAFDHDTAAPVTMKKGADTDHLYTGGAADVRFTSIAGADHAYQPGTTARLWKEFFSTRIRGGPLPPPPPEVAAINIVADVPEAFEAHRVKGSMQVSRYASDISGALAINYRVSGGAVPGTDYQALPGTVVIPAGQDSVRLKIKPLEDHAADGDKNVKVTLLAGDGYTIGDHASAKVKVVDKD